MNHCWYPAFREVIEQHFKLKKQSIRVQLGLRLQDDSNIRDLYSNIWEAYSQLEERSVEQQLHRHQQHKQRHRQRVSPATATAPIDISEDGVMLLDGDDDERDFRNRLNQVVKNPRKTVGTTVSTTINLFKYKGQHQRSRND